MFEELQEFEEKEPGSRRIFGGARLPNGQMALSKLLASRTLKCCYSKVRAEPWVCARYRLGAGSGLAILSSSTILVSFGEVPVRSGASPHQISHWLLDSAS